MLDIVNYKPGLDIRPRPGTNSVTAWAVDTTGTTDRVIDRASGATELEAVDAIKELLEQRGALEIGADFSGKVIVDSEIEVTHDGLPAGVTVRHASSPAIYLQQTGGGAFTWEIKTLGSSIAISRLASGAGEFSVGTTGVATSADFRGSAAGGTRFVSVNGDAGVDAAPGFYVELDAVFVPTADSVTNGHLLFKAGGMIRKVATVP